MPDSLTAAEREARLPALIQSGWHPVAGRDAIRKIMKFRNFSEAWAFMNRVALFAEKIDHHPEWHNVYSRVDVTLTTHDCNGLSMLDMDMATRIDMFSVGAVTLPVPDAGAG
jgi:4a-hydroxytetrahydrobiopterin dehydratase